MRAYFRKNMRSSHQDRLQGREAQSRAWTQPLPTPQTFNIRDGTRQRVEWDTRDTINNRLWADTISAGSKAVTSEMLSQHVSHGSAIMQPSASTDDRRPYRFEGQYFPDAKDPLERPRLPPQSLFMNPWLQNYNIEVGDVSRELRTAVTEDNRYLTEDASRRIAGRTFEHQWIPAAATNAIASQKLEASELLRPTQDDYRRSFLSLTPSQNSPV